MESNAAVAGLIKWVLELNIHDVQLQTISSSSSSSTIQIISGNQTWTVYVRQVEWNSQDSLYLLRIRYPSGNVVGYYAYVNHVRYDIYHVSILHEGSDILITYEVNLNWIQGTDIVKIISIKTIITPPDEQNAINNYTGLIGGTNTTT
jgi:hypothetical protein